MSYIRVCDLCGKPMPLDDGGRKFKIKEYWTGFFGSSWITVEAHDECLKRLFDALDDKREAEGGRVMKFVDAFGIIHEMESSMKPQTNADRIRSMTDEELAEWVWGAETAGRAYGPRGKHSWLDWLREEVPNG